MYTREDGWPLMVATMPTNDRSTVALAKARVHYMYSDAAGNRDRMRL